MFSIYQHSKQLNYIQMRGLRIVANRHKQGNYIWLCCICVSCLFCMSSCFLLSQLGFIPLSLPPRNFALEQQSWKIHVQCNTSDESKFLLYIHGEHSEFILVFLFTATKSSIVLPSVYLGPAGRLLRYPKKTWIQRLCKRGQNLFIYFDHIRIVTMLSRWSLWHPLSHLLS